MWPYNHCEWKNVTYGISEAKTMAVRKYEQLKMEKMIQELKNHNQSNTRDIIALVTVCIIPTLVLSAALLLFVK